MWTRPYRTASELLTRFFGDRRGVSAVYLAFAIVPLIGFIGMATDTARGFLVKSRLSSALDAAALAGGRSFFKDDRDDEIRMFFDVNFPEGYMNASVNGPSIAADEEDETLTLTADATIPTSFMRVLGFETLTVSGVSEVTRQMQALDVVLAIDMSGSMGSSMDGSTRIAAARQAATDLVDILFGNNSSKDLLNIGLVPWNGKVNVTLTGTSFDPGGTIAVPTGTFTNPVTGSAQSVTFEVNNSPVPLLSAPPNNWRGCVYNRYLDDAFDDNDADVLDPAIDTGGAAWMAWEPVGQEGEPVWPGVCSSSPGWSECTPCLSHGILPLQKEKSEILSGINALQSPTGVTNIPQGLGWAWRVLSPEAPFSEAVADPDYAMQRAIVLLTDGANVGGFGDGYKAVFGTSSSARPEMNARLLELAANIKASGIVLYVIQFAYANSDLQTLLQQVASGTDSPYYHFAPNANALKAVFHEVANDLSELRLSK